MSDLRAVGDRIEAVLDQLRTSTDRRVFELVEEAVGLVTDLYGGGLERVLELVDDGTRDQLVGDELVGALLMLHDLHPLSLEDRVMAALEEVRPYMDSHGGDVEVLRIDEAEGVLHLRMLGSCDGCPSSSVTLQTAVQRAMEEFAPEIAHIDVVDDTPPPPPISTPIQLGRKPVTAG